MRRQKTVRVGGVRFTVREFRVRDVYWLLEAGKDEPAVDMLLAASLGTQAAKFGRRGSELTSALWAAVEEINQAFFKPAATAAKSKGRALTPESLTEYVCRLIERGHKDPWDYGWGFFLQALTVSEKLENERLRQAALAGRVAQTDKISWKRFFKKLMHKKNGE